MFNHIQGWDITKKLQNKHKIYIRQFTGSKVTCMNDYVKPCRRENNPGQIFHVGSNDIPTSKDPLAIAQCVVRDASLRSSGSFDRISFSECLNNLRQRNINCLFLAHININSIRNKFDQLVSSIKNNIDILMISETKTDNSFSPIQFHFEGYCIYRLDRNKYGGGILVYVQSSSIEGFFIELNLRCKRWLLSCSYNSHQSLISEHLSIIGKDLDLLSASYDKIFLMGDFNAEPHDHFLVNFCDVCNLKNLIKVPTCFKNPESPTSIDVMLTNSCRSFPNSCGIETGLSDFHKMIVTI